MVPTILPEGAGVDHAAQGGAFLHGHVPHAEGPEDDGAEAGRSGRWVDVARRAREIVAQASRARRRGRFAALRARQESVHIPHSSVSEVPAPGGGLGRTGVARRYDRVLRQAGAHARRLFGAALEGQT